jgi:hypothetical protein
MGNNEGMGRREISPETLDDDVIADHKKARVDNHGSQAKAAKLYRRRARRLVAADLRNGRYDD